jgi:hypothetical protein
MAYLYPLHYHCGLGGLPSFLDCVVVIELRAVEDFVLRLLLLLVLC